MFFFSKFFFSHFITYKVFYCLYPGFWNIYCFYLLIYWQKFTSRPPSERIKTLKVFIFKVISFTMTTDYKLLFRTTEAIIWINIRISFIIFLCEYWILLNNKTIAGLSCQSIVTYPQPQLKKCAIRILTIQLR